MLYTVVNGNSLRFPLLLTELYFLFMLKNKYLLSHIKGKLQRAEVNKLCTHSLFIKLTKHSNRNTYPCMYMISHHDFPLFSHLCIRNTNLPTYIVVTLINLFFTLCINVRLSILFFV